MKTTDLKLLAALSRDMVASLADASAPISDERYKEQSSETHATYLANIKASIQQSASALIELARRCDGAVALVEMEERQQEAQAALRKALSTGVELARGSAFFSPGSGANS